ncbi:ABC transporter ATP-binding protein [Evansella sp. AB-rgal1]|uniref:ABC transporter ATP-binding protein n=1 Tax=Evansella sp. AB-rgal1 TaxID=3242696 RepID=UPI00359E3295
MKIHLKGIEKRFGKLQALKPIELEVSSGEFLSLLGPSGCGKTTLLRIIAGLEEADDGEMEIGNQLVFSKKQKRNIPPQKRNIGMVFQDFALWPHMTVFENVAYGLRAKGQKKGIKENVMEALQNVQLHEFADRFPHQISGGQQQRVAIARAIVNDPEIILLDEPLSALDATLRDEMRILLQSLVKKLNMTAIYVTHDQSEAMAMSDRIVVMSQGEILQIGTPEVIYQQPINSTVASFVGKGSLLEGTYKKQQEQYYLELTGQVTVPLPIMGVGDAIELHNWISVIIRPEAVSLSTLSGKNRVKGIVETVSFLGERYEISFVIAGTKETLFAYSSERLTIGQTVFFEIVGSSLHIIQSIGGVKHETA